MDGCRGGDLGAERARAGGDRRRQLAHAPFDVAQVREVLVHAPPVGGAELCRERSGVFRHRVEQALPQRVATGLRRGGQLRARPAEEPAEEPAQ